MLRRGLPAPTSGPQFVGEHAFYRLVLGQARQYTDLARVEQVFDVGCRNWSYVRALAEAFPKARLFGVEVDGGRRYVNLYRRIDMARAHAAELCAQGRAAEVIYGDFRHLDLSAVCDDHEVLTSGSSFGAVAFCFLFPFVSTRPCRRWGLPSSFANFEELLSRASVMGPCRGKRIFVSCHQGDWEAEIAREAWAGAGFSPRESILRHQQFEGLWPNPYDVHVFVV